MDYRRVVSKFPPLVTSCVLLVGSACGSSSQGTSQGADGSTDSPITIYYALNESHSNSWVQRSADGVVGIVYGRGEGRPDSNSTKNLLYRTIQPDASEAEEVVTADRGTDKSVLLYDSGSNPHIFYASSDTSNQVIRHFYKQAGSGWLRETVVEFFNEGGQFIYELSAAIDRNDIVHLLVLKTRTNPDSEDFFDAYLGSCLYHITNSGGRWEKTLIHQYDTFYTDDMYVKAQRRQDIAVDGDGFVHVVFGEQYRFNPGNDPNAVGRLLYATNRSSRWVIEVALSSPTTTDDAGWFPSLAIDRAGRPVVASVYVARVATHSALYAQLCYSVRVGDGRWETTVVADRDDGYFGSDGRNYTGALPNLKIDSGNRPHIVFSDIASSHRGSQALSIGQIRYAVSDGASWDTSTIYRQPSPEAFYQGREMGGQSLVMSEDGERVQVVGQELISAAEGEYHYQLVRFVIR